VQESLTVEYKAADALGKSDGKKKEITKDVSAFANSAGGVIFYGVKEYDDPSKRHLPETIDPVDQASFSKEWLEQVINNIRPRINGLIIHSVPINSGANQVVCVVEVPQGTTAHQAKDYKYYKRFNFQSVPMEDYEVRDVMGRKQHPQIDLEFEVELSRHSYTHGIGTKTIVKDEVHLKARARNSGLVYAQFVNCFMSVPTQVMHKDELEDREVIAEDGTYYAECYGDNTISDVVGIGGSPPYSHKIYGPSRYEPILPGLSQKLTSIQLQEDFSLIEFAGFKVKWSVHADNAQPKEGETLITDLEIADRRE
jgi:hypothetical protein